MIVCGAGANGSSKQMCEKLPDDMGRVVTTSPFWSPEWPPTKKTSFRCVSSISSEAFKHQPPEGARSPNAFWRILRHRNYTFHVVKHKQILIHWKMVRQKDKHKFIRLSRILCYNFYSEKIVYHHSGFEFPSPPLRTPLISRLKRTLLGRIQSKYNSLRHIGTCLLMPLLQKRRICAKLAKWPEKVAFRRVGRTVALFAPPLFNSLPYVGLYHID